MKSLNILYALTVLVLAYTLTGCSGCGGASVETSRRSRYTLTQSDTTSLTDSQKRAKLKNHSSSSTNDPASYSNENESFFSKKDERAKLKYQEWIKLALSEMERIDRESANKNDPIVAIALTTSAIHSTYSFESAPIEVLEALEEMAAKHAEYFAKHYKINPMLVDTLLSLSLNRRDNTSSVFVAR